MRKINLILLLISVMAISCKKDESKKEIVEEKPFTIEMNINSQENDVICIYYKDSTIGFFSEEMAMYKNVIKSDSTQNVVFEVREGVIPNDFRLDLSHENSKQVLKINKITFSNKGKSFEIIGKDLNKYFTPNNTAIFNNQNETFSFTKNVDGSYDPFLSTTGQFYPLLETLVGSKAFIQVAN